VTKNEYLSPFLSKNLEEGGGNSGYIGGGFHTRKEGEEQAGKRKANR